MTKICSKCGLEKGLVDFYKDRRKKDRYRSDCKACHTPVVRQYQSTACGKATAKRADIKRTGTVTRKASHNLANKRYKKTPHGRKAEQACHSRRRELKANLDSIFFKEDIETVYKRFSSKCFACGSTEKLSIDHHRPLSDGYALSHDNAVILCVSCNASKGPKSPTDFYTKKQLETLNGFGIV